LFNNETIIIPKIEKLEELLECYDGYKIIAELDPNEEFEVYKENARSGFTSGSYQSS
jgi:hypothetical protein